MVSGVIFAVEEFAVHDGPGIRKTVFFKGCPLRCNWCHNPEGLSFAPELWVNSSLCQACGRCHAVCVTAGSYDRSSCTGCGNCLLVCPLRLRRICGRTVDAEALATELLIGNDLLAASGGGYTLSGGEPLAQPDFAAELIERLRPSHIALETSGFAPSAVFSRVCSLVDLVMIDIKQVDPVVHRAMTGVENRQILANLRDLIETGRPFIARIPLIPGSTIRWPIWPQPPGCWLVRPGCCVLNYCRITGQPAQSIP